MPDRSEPDRSRANHEIVAHYYEAMGLHPALAAGKLRPALPLDGFRFVFQRLPHIDIPTFCPQDIWYRIHYLVDGYPLCRP